MQDFIYKLIEDGTYCIMEYKGDEANVAIPDTYCGAPITVLYDNLFRGHSEITSLYIPNSVTDIGELVFAGCDNLRQIKLPSQLYFLWGMSFARSSFEEIIIPDRVTSLPPFAFSDCKRLKRVVCGSGMRKIHSWVFGGCNNLQELVMGQNVEVSPDAFKKKGKNLNTLGGFDTYTMRGNFDPFKDDPVLNRYEAYYRGLLEQVIGPQLGISFNRRFRGTHSGVQKTWDYSTKNRTTAQQLAAAMRRNPRMRAFFVNGLFDICTQTGLVKYTMRHGALPADRTFLKEYMSGHMIYVGEDNSRQVSSDIRLFLQGGTPENVFQIQS